MNTRKKAGSAIGAVTLAIVLLVFVDGCKKDRAEAQEAAASAAQAAKSESRQGGRFNEMFLFVQHGDVFTVKVRSHAAFYPKGGCILITNPQGGSWRDCPGVQVNRNPVAPGHFSFAKIDSSAWGVEIWQ